MTASKFGPADLTASICEDILKQTYDDHPRSVIAFVEQAIVDALGNALLARSTPLGRAHLDQLAAVSAGDTVLGGGAGTPVDAAFVNAGLINAMDWDDTAGGHPGSSVIPAAMYAAQQEGATTHQFVNGVLVGYEVSIRVARALQPSWRRYDVVHGSGTRHAIGAGAAIAAIGGGTTDAVEEYLGTTAQLAPVPHAGSVGWEAGHVTWLKDNNARASTAAVRAAEFPSTFRGTPGVLEGPAGFWRMAGSDQCDWEQLATPIGEPYLVTELELKPYPCCRWLHSAVEAAAQAAAELDEARSIRVETAKRIASKCQVEPTNQVNAQFSIPFVVALASRGISPYDWYTSEGPRAMPEVEVTLEGADDLSEHYQATTDVGARVTVTDATGSTATVTIERPLGCADRPLSPSASDEKLARGLASTVGGDGTEGVEAIRELLGNRAPIGELFDRLTTGVGS